MSLWPFYKSKEPSHKEFVGLDSMFKKKESGKYAVSLEGERCFTGITLQSSYKVMFTQKDIYSVEIQSSMKQLGEITVDITHNMLTLGQKQVSYPANFFKNVIVYVTAPNINTLNLFGSGIIDAKNNFDSNINWGSLQIILTGSGTVNVSSCMCDLCFIKVTGSGTVNCGQFHVNEKTIINVTGSGDCIIKDLETQRINNTVFGSGDIFIHSIKTGYAENVVNGSGSIRILGSISHWHNQKNGSGSINMADI